MSRKKPLSANECNKMLQEFPPLLQAGDEGFDPSVLKWRKECTSSPQPSLLR